MASENSMTQPTNPDAVRDAADVALRESYVHCQSPSVQNQIKHLSQAEQVTWFAGHHSGFHAGYATALKQAPEVLRLVEALKQAQKYICEHSYSCMRHEVCPTSHGLECEEAREALAEFERERG